MNINVRTDFGITLIAFLLLAGSAYAKPFAYVANWGDNNVSVIDTASNKIITNVSVGTKTQSVAANPMGTMVYVTDPIIGEARDQHGHKHCYRYRERRSITLWRSSEPGRNDGIRDELSR